MALSGYEKQKRWREKNRALYNLQQRNRRKNLGVVPVLAEPRCGLVSNDTGVKMLEPATGDARDLAIRATGKSEVRESTCKNVGLSTTDLAATSKTSKDSTLHHLRSLIKQEEEKPPTDDSRKPSDVVGGIYRNDQGGVISKFAWEKLQRLKEKAKKGGYELDEYSQ